MQTYNYKRNVKYLGGIGFTDSTKCSSCLLLSTKHSQYCLAALYISTIDEIG